ncbi:HAMP domain-containing protein, partial [Acinetobacter baumannii]
MAEAMENLAAGDTTATVPGQGRDDEIGVMASAFEVFRTARETACANELKQQTVVTELADALEALAAGDMTYRITTPFADQ